MVRAYIMKKAWVEGIEVCHEVSHRNCGMSLLTFRCDPKAGEEFHS